jgi:hypothetical protein
MDILPRHVTDYFAINSFIVIDTCVSCVVIGFFMVIDTCVVVDSFIVFDSTFVVNDPCMMIDTFMITDFFMVINPLIVILTLKVFEIQGNRYFPDGHHGDPYLYDDTFDTFIESL